MKISPAFFKDQQAVRVESDRLQALFLPERGANLASFIDKPTGRQILYQRPGASYRVQPYNGIYTEAENAGMDDMFPTIDRCACLDDPWQGAILPDHGEVWSLPWKVAQEEDAIVFSVHGVRLPYTLEKRVHFPAPHLLRFDYCLTNHAPFAFDTLWAAHAMFNSEADAEILLPPGVNGITTTMSSTGALGQYGDSFAWPIATLPDGSQRDLRRLRAANTREVNKYYLRGALPAGWCAVKFPHSGYAIALSWPVERVPYLAVLPNEGGWDDTASLYFEPTTTTFDRPDLGRYHNQVARLDGYSTRRWHLTIAVTTDLRFTSVTPQGFFA
jgi:hypothetical protein